VILGSVMRRYNEIIHLLDLSPGTYRPVLAELDDGTLDASDWAVGFIQAMALCQEAWTPLAADPAAGALMVPIVLVASTTDMVNLHLDEDEKLPEDEMAQLLAEAGPMLSLRHRHQGLLPATPQAFTAQDGGPEKTPASLIGSARRGAAKLAS